MFTGVSISKFLKEGGVTITFNTENINAIFAGVDEVNDVYCSLLQS